MSEILSRAAAPALRELGIHFLVDPDDGTIVIPYQTDAGTRLLLNLAADDEQEDAIIYAHLVPVPERRISRVAVLLAELNARFKYTTFSLASGGVRVDVCIDLSHTTDASARITHAYHRITYAIEETQARIERAVKTSRTRTRVEREVEQIIRGEEF